MKGIFSLFSRPPIRNALVLAIITLPYFVLCQGNSVAGSHSGVERQANDEPSSQKYREIFFPQGMPSAEDPDSGQQKKTLYAFYDEAKIANGFMAVLYSKKIPHEGDSDYSVYLGLLSQSGPQWNVAQTVDLTEQMPVETENPGNFYKMDGRTNAFKISADIPGLHVNLWAVLAGTGSISGASDLFFRMTPDHQLKMLLGLKGTSKYSRIGSRQYTLANSSILVGDINGNGNTEIIVEKTQVEDEQGKRQVRSEKPAVYRLVDDQYKVDGTVDKSIIASHVHELLQLPRSKFIRVITPGEAVEGKKN